MTSPVEETYNDAFQLLQAKLAEWGIDDLDESALQILTEGYSPEVSMLRLQETPQYRERFKANERRLKKGLPVLSPGEYVSTERAYISTAREFGLPQGFYDEREDFVRWLEGDVSPQEFRERAQGASQAYINAPQDVKEQWSTIYGLTPGDAVAAFLDENRAMDVLNRRSEAVRIGAEYTQAFGQQSSINQFRAEQLVDAGVSQQDAQRGFQSVASRLGRDQFLGRLAGEDFTQREAEDEELLDDTGAAAERDRIYGAERARFAQNYLPTTSAGLSRAPGSF